MTTLDTSDIRLTQLITHHIGNKLREEGVDLSQELTRIEEESVSYLLTYFLQAFKTEEWFNFSHSVSLEMNEVYAVAQRLFSGEDFVSNSQNLAKLLYECCEHPKIKEGAFHVAYFEEVGLNALRTETIGIFKSETNVPFMQFQEGDDRFSIRHDFGFDLKGLDKGCLIFKTGDNYKVLIVDHANKFGDTKYWAEDFLQITPCSDEYHNTKEFLSMAKTFVTEQMDEEFELTKTDKIDLLNRSVQYFKENDAFTKQDFVEDVFAQQDIIESFLTYDKSYQEDKNVKVADSFDISPQAVRKQARIFKSVLKLDKNFHVYIHGNRDLIERGVESDGRKYYKIYYNEEK